MIAVSLSGCANDSEDVMATPSAPHTQSTAADVNVSNDAKQDAKPPEGVKFYTMDEVAKHNTPQDCWTVVDGGVADVTSFFSEHPGGDDKLAQACGKDATQLFMAQVKHDPKGMAKFKTMIIGSLKVQ